MDVHQACKDYIKLMKREEDLTPDQLALAKESFKEGWMQAEAYYKPKKDPSDAQPD